MSDEVEAARLNGYLHVLGMLIKRLDQAGVIPADEFAAELEAEAELIKADWAGVYAPGTPRDDERLLRLLAISIKGNQAPTWQFGMGVGADAHPPSNDED